MYFIIVIVFITCFYPNLLWTEHSTGEKNGLLYTLGCTQVYNCGKQHPEWIIRLKLWQRWDHPVDHLSCSDTDGSEEWGHDSAVMSQRPCFCSHSNRAANSHPALHPGGRAVKSQEERSAGLKYSSQCPHTSYLESKFSHKESKGILYLSEE